MQPPLLKYLTEKKNDSCQFVYVIIAHVFGRTHKLQLRLVIGHGCGLWLLTMSCSQFHNKHCQKWSWGHFGSRNLQLLCCEALLKKPTSLPFACAFVCYDQVLWVSVTSRWFQAAGLVAA